MYEYDTNGRLSSVSQPTGEHTSLSTDVDASGAIARLRTDSTQQTALATNGNMLSVLHGKWLYSCSYHHSRFFSEDPLVVFILFLWFQKVHFWLEGELQRLDFTNITTTNQMHLFGDFCFEVWHFSVQFETSGS